jgi:hypothetical protein
MIEIPVSAPRQGERFTGAGKAAIVSAFFDSMESIFIACGLTVVRRSPSAE